MTASSDNSTPPDWAVAKVEAALRVGLSVPEIEQLLVAKGLSPAAATAVVNSILEGYVRAGQAPRELPRSVHIAVSTAFGCGCLLLAYGFGGGLSVARTLIAIMGPLGFIWYPEMMSYAAPGMSRFVAWLVLLIVAGYRLFLLWL